MTAIVVYVDQLDAPGKISTTVAQMLTLARGAGEPVAVVAGPATAELLAELGAYGVEQVGQAGLVRQEADVALPQRGVDGGAGRFSGDDDDAAAMGCGDLAGQLELRLAGDPREENHVRPPVGDDVGDLLEAVNELDGCELP